MFFMETFAVGLLATPSQPPQKGRKPGSGGSPGHHGQHHGPPGNRHAPSVQQQGPTPPTAIQVQPSSTTPQGSPGGKGTFISLLLLLLPRYSSVESE